MFKVGDKVRRIIDTYTADDINMTVGNIYTVEKILSPTSITVVECIGYWYSNKFELVEESNVNPCIKTEEVKIVKTKVVSGRLDQVFRIDARKNDVWIVGGGKMLYDASDLRKLARQLDEIANVLEGGE